MSNRQPRSIVSIIAMILLLWLSLGSGITSALSFVGALPARWPAFVHFGDSPAQWRAAFFAAGCLGLSAAYLVYRGRLRPALGATLAFAVLYVPVFPVVWGQRSIGMIAAVVALFLVGLALLRSPRDETANSS